MSHADFVFIVRTFSRNVIVFNSSYKNKAENIFRNNWYSNSRDRRKAEKKFFCNSRHFYVSAYSYHSVDAGAAHKGKKGMSYNRDFVLAVTAADFIKYFRILVVRIIIYIIYWN